MTRGSPFLADQARTHLVGLYAGDEEAARRAEAWRKADSTHEAAWCAAERIWILLGALGDQRGGGASRYGGRVWRLV
jgi:ferric-dicitrate binding protein FerR (iron transport regulator)